MRAEQTKIVVPGACIIACALLPLLICLGALGLVFLNTSFSSGYSRAKFGLIKEGDTVEVVLMSLGPPLQMTVNYGPSGGLPLEIAFPRPLDIQNHLHNPSGNLVFQYSRCLHRYGDQFRNVSVTLTNGCVQSKRNEVYHEWW